VMARFHDVVRPEMPRIRCAKCDKLVDQVNWYYDECRQATKITVWCHGEKDSMALTPEFLFRLTPDERRQLQASEGVAFVSRGVKVQDNEHGCQDHGTGHGNKPLQPILPGPKDRVFTAEECN
jgi:hypothetical protein